MRKQKRIHFAALLTLVFMAGFFTVVCGMIGLAKYFLN